MANESLEYLTEKAAIALLETSSDLDDLAKDHYDDNEEEDEFQGIMVLATVEENLSHSVDASPARRVESLTLEIELRGLIFESDPVGANQLWRSINDALLFPNAPAVMALPIFHRSTTPFSHFTVASQMSSSREDNDTRRMLRRRFKIIAALRG